MEWKNVYIFISSTFNDMHAERDYLVKHVFPELRAWCSERKLKLIDIDLRWGVSEKDASENKRVVEVCLNNIDKCRPFFLGFLGQRRGWVPDKDQINAETERIFPELSGCLGAYSITELEIIHALFKPLDGRSPAVRHALFYYRDPAYLETIQDDSVRKIYCPENSSVLEDFKQRVRESYPVWDYRCTYNEKRKLLEKFVMESNDAASHYALGDHIIYELKKAIEDEFPDRSEIQNPETALERELEHQENYLFRASDSYISRPDEEQKILDYIKNGALSTSGADERSEEADNTETNTPYLCLAHAGTGKTSLIAHLIWEKMLGEHVYYRFCGLSKDSAFAESTLDSIATQLVADELLGDSEYSSSCGNFVLEFPDVLINAAERLRSRCGDDAKLVIILEAIDQWQDVDRCLNWVDPRIPSNVRFIISAKTDGDTELISELHKKQLYEHELQPLESKEEKRAIIKGYFSEFLKDIDDDQMAEIIAMNGSSNPLFLKIVMNELRIHGEFETLFEKIRSGYGTTPSEAFRNVIIRLLNEDEGEYVKHMEMVYDFLGMLAYSLYDLSIKGVARTLVEVAAPIRLPDGKESLSELSDEEKEFFIGEVTDALESLVKHLGSYLRVDGDNVTILYDSFRQSIKEIIVSGKNEFRPNTLLAHYYASKLCVTDPAARYANADAETMFGHAYYLCKLRRKNHMAFFFLPEFLLRSIQFLGVETTASFYKEFAEGDEITDKKELVDIAGLLIKRSAQIEVRPEVVFWEIKRALGVESPYIKYLLQTAEKSIDADFYYPIMADKTPGLAPERRNSMIRFGESLFELAKRLIIYRYSKDYIISIDQRKWDELESIIMKEISEYGDLRPEVGEELGKNMFTYSPKINIQSKATGKLVNIKKTDWQISLAFASDECLYLVFEKKHKYIYEKYELPSMKLLEEKTFPEMAEKEKYINSIACGEEFYSITKTEKEETEVLTCYRMSDGISWSIEYKVNTASEDDRNNSVSVDWNGPFLHVSNKFEKTVSIFYIPDGSHVKTWTGVEDYSVSGVFLYHYMLVEKDSLYLFNNESDHMVIEKFSYDESGVRHVFRKPFQLPKYTTLRTTGNNVSGFEHEGKLYLWVRDDIIAAFDMDMNYQGQILLEADKPDELTIMDNGKLGFASNEEYLIYSIDELLGALTTEPIEGISQNVLRVYEGNTECAHLIGMDCVRIDPEEGVGYTNTEVTGMFNMDDISSNFFSTPVLMGHSRFSNGDGIVGIQRTDYSMLYRMVKDYIPGKRLERYFMNNTEVFRIYSSEDTKEKNYEIRYNSVLSMNDENVWKLDVECSDNSEVIILPTSNDTYILLNRVVGEHGNLDIKIYSAKERAEVFHYSNDTLVEMTNSDTHFLRNCVLMKDRYIFTGYDKRVPTSYLFEFIPGEREVHRTELTCSHIMNECEGIIYLLDSNGNIVNAYSTIEHKVVETFDLGDDERPVYMYRKTSEDEDYYLIIMGSGIIEKRRADDFSLEFRQLFPEGAPSYLTMRCYNMKGSMLYSKSVGDRHVFYKKINMRDLLEGEEGRVMRIEDAKQS